MNLYKDNGANSFSWQAKWAESYSHNHFAQYGEKGTNEATIYIDYDEFYVSAQIAVYPDVHSLSPEPQTKRPW
jgi:hypothetical protein